MSRRQKITQSEIRKLLSYNKKTGILKWRISGIGRRKNRIAGNLNKSNGYLTIGIRGKNYYAHRLIWLGVYGYIPENDIDHKDEIKTHNWLKNLREVSKQCNSRNIRNWKTNKSGVKGVSWERSKWRVRIRANNKKYHIGISDSFDEAVCLRLAAEQCLDWNKCEYKSTAYIYVRKNIQNG